MHNVAEIIGIRAKQAVENWVNSLNSIPMVAVPAEQREEEEVLLAYARAMNGGDGINKFELMKLLQIASYTDDQCGASCNHCEFREACDLLEDYLEVFR